MCTQSLPTQTKEVSNGPPAPERDREAGNRVTTAATMAAVNGSSAASKVEKFEHEGGAREGNEIQRGAE